MKDAHPSFNPIQATAIRKTLDKLMSIAPEQFDSRAEIDGKRDLTGLFEKEIRGGIILWCLIAKEGSHAAAIADVWNTLENAAEYLQLDHKQTKKLLHPRTKTVDYWCKDKECQRYLTHERAINAVWYFYREARIKWARHKLLRYIAKHPLPKTQGIY